ncbi:hypothetical protein [Micromonospora sp. b486]|uniref:hypothetical protein n=1 Tax=Micromonospora sp. b486 TaxID=3053986 RepID=UPI00259CE654|nr:hypothetical protein [Micromonospora sp. b486]MDM4783347.1 hypothetical protein [Micromonospora sp. b486]
MFRTPALSALAALPMLVACAAPGASASPHPPPSSRQSLWPQQQALTDAAVVVDSAAGARWPDAYAGVSLDVAGGVLLVHRIPAAGLDAAVRDLAAGVRVWFVDARHSARTLDGWAGRVTADVGYWQRRGVVVHSVGTDIGQCVRVEVANPGRDSAPIIGHYRPMALCVRQGSPAEPLPAG